MPQVALHKGNFEDFYRDFRNTVLGICRRYQPNSMLSEEVFQDIFLKIYTKLPIYFQSLEHKKAYVIRLSINECISYFRKQKTEIGVLADEAADPISNPALQVENKELLETIDGFIHEQDEDIQPVLWLYLYNEYSLRKICEIYELSYHKTYRQTKRIIEELRGILEKKNLNLLDKDFDLVEA